MMNKKEIIGICEFLKVHHFENSYKLYDYIEELKMEYDDLKIVLDKYKEVIDKIKKYIETTDTFQLIHSTDGLGEKLREKTKKDLLELLEEIE